MDDLKIKHLKPKKNSIYHQGSINPKTLTKYYESASDQPVIYRSGLELQFINYCETNPQIVKWASEAIGIDYYCRIDKKTHTYYPDYIIESKSGQKTIIEIKPYNQTVKPKMTDSLWLKQSWIKNVDKWKAAKAWATKNGLEFMIVTEKFFP